MAPRRALFLLVSAFVLSTSLGCSIYAVLVGTVCDPGCAQDEICEQGSCVRAAQDAGEPSDRDAGPPDTDTLDVPDGGLDAGLPDAAPVDTGLPDVDAALDAGLPDVSLPDAALDCQAFEPDGQVCDNPPAGACLVGNDPGLPCAAVCGGEGLFCAQGTWDPGACPGLPEASSGCNPDLEDIALAPNWGLTCECRAGPTPLVEDCPPPSGGDVACSVRNDGCAYAVVDVDCLSRCADLGLGCRTAFENLPDDGCLIDINNTSEHDCGESRAAHYCLCGPPDAP